MDNNRVLLISPARKKLRMTGHAHLGIGLIAQKLIDNNFEVKVLDYLIDRNIPTVSEAIESFNPGTVGITINSAFWNEADAILDEISAHPNIKILVGGPHPTLYHEELQEDRRVHYVFRGESEDNVVEVCLEPDLPESAVVIQPSRPDMNSLPHPAFNKFYHNQKITEYPLQTSRGCPFGCIFCEISNISSKKWRPISLDYCFEEVQRAKAGYPEIRMIEILDDNPAFRPDHFKEFLKRYIEEKGNWELIVDNIRADNIDEEIVSLLEEAKCKTVCVGVEHGNPEMFKGINKGETLEQISESARIIKRSKLKLGMCFVIGLPGDSFEKTKDSIRFAKKNKADFMFWNIIVPHKGTKVREWYDLNGHIYDDRNFSPNVEDPIMCDTPVIDSKFFPRDEILKTHFYAVLSTNNYRLTKPNRMYVIKTAIRFGFYLTLLWSIIVQLYRKNFVK